MPPRVSADAPRRIGSDAYTCLQAKRDEVRTRIAHALRKRLTLLSTLAPLTPRYRHDERTPDGAHALDAWPPVP